MPSPVATYAVYSAGADTTNLVTPTLSPIPVNGDVLVIKLSTWDTGTPSGAVSGGGQTYSTAITAAPGGFNGYIRIDTCTISGSPGAFAVTSGGTATNSRHSMVVEHYLASAGAFLAATPATAQAHSAASPPSVAITTAGSGSIVSWCSTDENSVDPATRAYLLSGIEDGLFDGHAGGNGVNYYAYAAVGAAGSYTAGLSAPTGQAWNIAAIEIRFTASATATPAPLVITPPQRPGLRPPPVLLSRANPANLIVTPVPPAKIYTPIVPRVWREGRAIVRYPRGDFIPSPSPGDIDVCALEPVITWYASSLVTDWPTGEPVIGWVAIEPEEDC